MQMEGAMPKQPRTRLMDLDDACLMLIFKHLMPLPDLFQVAQSCWRFHRLTTDKRMWLVVAPCYIPPEDTPSGRAGPVYASLAAAVAASRPGDTIWLAPNMRHEACDVSVSWPLHILGGGQQPEDTQVTTPPAADFALSFCASSKLAMLAISTTRCPCLVHRKGLLTVERCSLSSDPQGLQHLVSPVLTLAASLSPGVLPVPPGALPAAAAAACVSPADAGRTLAPALLTDAQLLPPPAAAAAAVAKDGFFRTPKPPISCSTVISSSRTSSIVASRLKPVVGNGRLVVVECKLEGGSTAVRCGGTGRLRDVRVIYESHAAFFWLEVDSADPGSSSSSSSSKRSCLLPSAVSAGALEMRQQGMQAGRRDTLVKLPLGVPGPAAVAAAASQGRAAAGTEYDKLLQLNSKVCEWQQCRMLGTATSEHALESFGGSQQPAALPQQQQQPQQQQPSMVGRNPGAAGGPLHGLARIHQVLGKHISPAMLAAHLGARSQQQQQHPDDFGQR